MKKVLMSLLLVLATVVVSAQAADKIKVGFANRTLNGAFFNGLTEYMKIHAKERGYD
jgi:ribose transport system substrate-binding protein